MFDKLDILRMSSAMATHASARQSAISRNVANADTPGYVALDAADFSATYAAESTGPGLRTTRAGHLGATDAAYTPEIGARSLPGTLSPNGNAVSLEIEMMKAAEVRQDHDMALAIYKSSMGILRTSIGRG